MDLIHNSEIRLSAARCCKLLGMNRSSYYYSPKESPQDQVTLMNEIQGIWEKHPFYGYRRITEILRRNGFHINRKRVYRLMRKMGLQALYAKPRTSIRNKEHKVYPYLLRDVDITHVNQVWATDITYIKLDSGFVYLIAIIDLYSRYILGWTLSTTLDTTFCLEALEDALDHGTPLIFNTDQGCQFTSESWVAALSDQGVAISMDGKGRCMDNIYVERLWRTIKYEEVYLQAYNCVVEARKSLGKYIEFYNNERPHQSLKYSTPAEVFGEKWRNSKPDGYVDNFSNEKFPTYPQAPHQQPIYI